ncbi:MAG: hydantoinase/oxoprolinase family protein, partial [Nitrospinota bacterium]
MQQADRKRYRLGFDVGGTFTDFAVYDEESGSVLTAKVLTTPANPADGVITGLRQIAQEYGIALSDIHQAVHHGTTLIINALIERKGARTGLITTRGFRDVLEFQREFRYDIYDLNLVFPSPLVPRFLRKEVTERTLYDGTILTPLQQDEAEQVVRELLDQGVEAIAVCLLHSYKNPAHERIIGEIVTRLAPQVALSLSSDILAELREYERTVLTVMNAYVQPLARRYLTHLHTRLREEGFQDVWHVMASNGGVLTVEKAATYPVRTLESGPVGGALAAAYYGKLTGFTDLLSFDMGGTTAKSCVIQKGEISITTDYEVARAKRFKKGSGFPVKLPIVDMIEIGAGGGSIARIDELGLITVGPESAGANPGPACYGLGGEEPTVTDANLILGYLNPDYFLGGAMRLDRDASLRAIQKIADPLGMTPVEAAWGIHEIVNTNMAEAARTHMVERGVDARTLTLFAYGGA